MQKYLWAGIVIFIGLNSWLIYTLLGDTAENAVKNVNLEISQVILFRQGAEIRHPLEVTLKAGDTTLSLVGVAPQLDEKTIRITSIADVYVREVRFEKFTPEKQPNPDKSLADSLRFYTDSLEILKIQMEAITQERELLAANRNLTQAQDKVTPEQLKEMGVFVRTRYTELQKELRQNTQVQTEINEKLKKWQEKTASTKENPIRGRLFVKISTSAPITTQLTIQYLCTQAGWNPTYKVMLKSPKDSTATWQNQAEVWQQTGLDWQQVNLIFSTALPQHRNKLPALQPWTLALTRNKDSLSIADSVKKDSLMIKNDSVKQKESKAEAKSDSTAAEPMLETEIALEKPINLRSGEKARLIALTAETVKVAYTYQAIPSRAKEAFLIAEIADWKTYQIFPAETALYFEGSWLNTQFYQPEHEPDTLYMSLGKEGKIAVTRQQKVQEEADNFKRLETRTYRIRVRNTLASNIDLQLIEPFPITQENKLTIALRETSKATIDRQKGTATWLLALKPGQDTTLTFQYRLQYPKDQQLAKVE